MLTPLRRRWISPFACAIFIVGSIIGSSAQTETATLSGRISDSSGLGIVGAQVSLVDVDRNVTNTSHTSNTGLYTFTSVRPGRYRLQVSATGFRTVNLTSITVNAQDSLQQNVKLAVGSITESVTVEASSTPIGVSGAVGTVVDQQLIHELPLNGRSFQTLFLLTPGTVVASAGYNNEGQFSVNGERTNANYFTVDGASANAGIQAGGSPAQSLGGSLPALSTAGGTNSLVSTEAVQEFAIQTSSFAAEYGRSPGAQVSIVTKSGTNEYHGTAFNYLRNDIFDANDWFANHDGLKRSELRQNDFGGVFGGPIYKDHTFFFFSYEGLRLRQPTTGIDDVPTLADRQAAPAAVQPFLNAFPLPTGPEEGTTGLAPAVYGFSNPSTLNATSLRVDHHFGQSLTAFARYNYSPSSTSVRGVDGSLNTITDTNVTLQTLTLGLTHLITPKLTNDARFNWTRAAGSSGFREDNFGGATPLAPGSIFPQPFTPQNGLFAFFASFAGANSLFRLGSNAANTQRQINIVDNISIQAGAHVLKFGVDYRRLTPHVGSVDYGQTIAFFTMDDALSGTPSIVLLSAHSPVNSTYNNYSLYAQDTWATTPRLNLTYGIRWDYNPTPSFRGVGGLQPTVIEGVSNIAKVSTAPIGSPLYHATLNNFAPRVGLAYQLRNNSGSETVLKAGTGIFYDLGTGPAGFAATFAPFIAFRFPNVSSLPLTAAEAAQPTVTPNPPFTAPVVGYPHTLRLPYSYHWNLAIQQALGHDQTLSIGYVGSAAHSLLRNNEFDGGLPPDFASILLIDNSGFSNYNSLQAQFRRRTSHGLDLLASYTYAHALDDGSSENLSVAPGQFLNPRANYGPADFDIRHTGTVGLSYDVPKSLGSGIMKTLLGGWGVDPVFTARTAPPVDVVVQRDIGFGVVFPSNIRPDPVPGVPLYISDPTVGGGRRINPDAFSIPTEARQGTLRKNSLRGFPLVQLDLGLRRRFVLTERVALDARVEAFNILNLPNFAPPQNVLGMVDSSGTLTPRTDFGISQSILSRSLQPNSAGAGFNALYQVGGPRSLQFALKFEF